MNKDPKISIITVCKNSSSTIEKTIQSIIKQKCDNIEFIIIDGKSNDTTLSIIEKYKKDISKFISEEDYNNKKWCKKVINIFQEPSSVTDL